MSLTDFCQSCCSCGYCVFAPISTLSGAALRASTRPRITSPLSNRTEPTKKNANVGMG